LSVESVKAPAVLSAKLSGAHDVSADAEGETDAVLPPQAAANIATAIKTTAIRAGCPIAVRAFLLLILHYLLCAAADNVFATDRHVERRGSGWRAAHRA
jgi:hypothetical protein